MRAKSKGTTSSVNSPDAQPNIGVMAVLISGMPSTASFGPPYTEMDAEPVTDVIAGRGQPGSFSSSNGPRPEAAVIRPSTRAGS